jgi:hypothetical protein
MAQRQQRRRCETRVDNAAPVSMRFESLCHAPQCKHKAIFVPVEPVTQLGWLPVTEEAAPASSRYRNTWAGPGMIREADETLGQLPALTLAVGTEAEN